MGYTLVAEPSRKVKEKLTGIIPGTNKIPFSKDCDREEANCILPYHVTLFHWSREHDEKYLKLMKEN